MKILSKATALLSALVIAAACLSTGICAQESIEKQPNVKIDTSKTYQTIDGFGASYTWYADGLTTSGCAEQGYDWIFTDAEFNILRFRDLNRVQSDGEYQVALDGYAPYKSYYDAAVSRGIDPTVIVTSWGQYNRSLDFVAFTELDDQGHTYYTLAKDSNGEYMYEELADFCVESIKLFFDAGIPVHYFSISNETELQGLHIDEKGNAREEAGFYFGAEENEYHCAYWKAHIAIYNAFQEAFGEWAPSITGAEVMADTYDIMKKYLDPLIENAPESFDTIAHHLYGSENSPRSYKQVGDAYSDKYTLWQTEWYLNEYINHAEKMANEFIYENVNAYLYWNGVWIADTGNCLIELNGSGQSAEIRRMGNHYIMMHFSKYVKPGYKRVEVENNSKATVVAFKAPDSQRLVIVAINNTNDYEDLMIDIGDPQIQESMVYQTIGSDNRFKFKYWQDAGKFDRNGNELPPQSVTTFVLALPADPTYSAPTVEEKVNPFLKQSKADSDLGGLGNKNAVIIAVSAVAIVLISVLIIVVFVGKKKNKKNAKSDQ